MASCTPPSPGRAVAKDTVTSSLNFGLTCFVDAAAPTPPPHHSRFLLPCAELEAQALQALVSPHDEAPTARTPAVVSVSPAASNAMSGLGTVLSTNPAALLESDTHRCTCDDPVMCCDVLHVITHAMRAGDVATRIVPLQRHRGRRSKRSRRSGRATSATQLRLSAQCRVGVAQFGFSPHHRADTVLDTMDLPTLMTSVLMKQRSTSSTSTPTRPDDVQHPAWAVEEHPSSVGLFVRSRLARRVDLSIRAAACDMAAKATKDATAAGDAMHLEATIQTIHDAAVRAAYEANTLRNREGRRLARRSGAASAEENGENQVHEENEDDSKDEDACVEPATLNYLTLFLDHDEVIHRVTWRVCAVGGGDHDNDRENTVQPTQRGTHRTLDATADNWNVPTTVRGTLGPVEVVPMGDDPLCLHLATLSVIAPQQIHSKEAPEFRFIKLDADREALHVSWTAQGVSHTFASCDRSRSHVVSVGAYAVAMEILRHHVADIPWPVFMPMVCADAPNPAVLSPRQHIALQMLSESQVHMPSEWARASPSSTDVDTAPQAVYQYHHFMALRRVLHRVATECADAELFVLGHAVGTHHAIAFTAAQSEAIAAALRRGVDAWHAAYRHRTANFLRHEIPLLGDMGLGYVTLPDATHTVVYLGMCGGVLGMGLAPSSALAGLGGAEHVTDADIMRRLRHHNDLCMVSLEMRLRFGENRGGVSRLWGHSMCQTHPVAAHHTGIATRLAVSAAMFANGLPHLHARRRLLWSAAAKALLANAVDTCGEADVWLALQALRGELSWLTYLTPDATPMQVLAALRADGVLPRNGGDGSDGEDLLFAFGDRLMRRHKGVKKAMHKAIGPRNGVFTRRCGPTLLRLLGDGVGSFRTRCARPLRWVVAALAGGTAIGSRCPRTPPPRGVVCRTDPCPFAHVLALCDCDMCTYRAHIAVCMWKMWRVHNMSLQASLRIITKNCSEQSLRLLRNCMMSFVHAVDALDAAHVFVPKALKDMSMEVPGVYLVAQQLVQVEDAMTVLMDSMFRIEVQSLRSSLSLSAQAAAKEGGAPHRARAAVSTHGHCDDRGVDDDDAQDEHKGGGGQEVCTVHKAVEDPHDAPTLSPPPQTRVHDELQRMMACPRTAISQVVAFAATHKLQRSSNYKRWRRVAQKVERCMRANNWSAVAHTIQVAASVSNSWSFEPEAVRAQAQAEGRRTVQRIEAALREEEAEEVAEVGTASVGGDATSSLCWSDMEEVLEELLPVLRGKRVRCQAERLLTAVSSHIVREAQQFVQAPGWRVTLRHQLATKFQPELWGAHVQPSSADTQPFPQPPVA